MFMKIEKNKNITRFSQHLDKEYGKLGSKTRDKYQKGFEEFKNNVLPEESKNETVKNH